MRTMIAAVAVTLLLVSSSSAALPNVLFLLIDDLGWAEVSWHRAQGYNEVQTPNMDALVREGIELDQAYAYKLCSPTRSAIQSGRHPIHVNGQNIGMNAFDEANPFVGVSGIAVNMTGLATRLAEAGYAKRVFSGKWDAGLAWPEQTPLGRGYTDAAFYYNHMIDYYSYNVGKCGDLWERDLSGGNTSAGLRPLAELLNPRHCLVQNMTDPENPVKPFPSDAEGCTYVEDVFTNHTLQHIEQHDPETDGPLFAFHASHSIHTPLEVVSEAFDRFSFIDFEPRRAYHAMVWNVDRAIGRIVDALKAKNMYNNTIIIMTSDNGGPVYKQGLGGGNNYPLRGGKAGNWQGGVRVPSFVSGGAVPPSMRGKTLTGLVTAWDWYGTLIGGMAGLDVTDKRAAAAGLPQVDSVNQWDYIMGRVQDPPRKEMPLGTVANPKDIWCSESDVVVHGVIEHAPDGTLWKLLIGSEPQDIWTGPAYPNATTAKQPDSGTVFGNCGFDTGCLFDLTSDPGEHTDLAASNPSRVQDMMQRIKALNATVFRPNRPIRADLACKAAIANTAGGFPFWSPFASFASSE